MRFSTDGRIVFSLSLWLHMHLPTASRLEQTCDGGRDHNHDETVNRPRQRRPSDDVFPVTGSVSISILIRVINLGWRRWAHFPASVSHVNRNSVVVAQWHVRLNLSGTRRGVSEKPCRRSPQHKSTHQGRLLAIARFRKQHGGCIQPVKDALRA